uniref:Uncharacterized protein n=1 Tax=Physcomitrium patens TaxID=3218 RepID=A0A2K1IA75_PHYPA|nr:hypothetical protein PHYPA_030754 [Physcomitrium patens]
MCPAWSFSNIVHLKCVHRIATRHHKLDPVLGANKSGSLRFSPQLSGPSRGRAVHAKWMSLLSQNLQLLIPSCPQWQQAQGQTYLRSRSSL